MKPTLIALAAALVLLAGGCKKDAEDAAKDVDKARESVNEDVQKTRVPIARLDPKKEAGAEEVSVADQIRQCVPSKEYKVLGTDGFGSSDSRKKLRHFFEVDRYWVALAALEALADRGEIEPKVVAEAIAKFGIDPEKRNPLDC